MFTMDMYNGHFNNRFIDLHYFWAFCVSTQNGRVESISTVSVITVLGKTAPVWKFLKQSDN